MEGKNEIDINLLLFMGTLILFLLAVSVVLFIYLYRQRLLRQRTSMQEMQNKLKLDLLTSTIETLETERRRFAADLHDEIGGKLSALRLQLVQMNENKSDADQQKLLVGRSKEIIDVTIGNVRRISHNMMPPSLEMFGLYNALEEMCSWISDSSSLSVTLEYQLHGITLDSKKQLALYRIVQELMSNTIRHAQAGMIILSLSVHDRELLMKYKDDGKGLNLLEKENSKGMGFKNIEDRVKTIKGKISYSTPGKGFECIIHFTAN